MTDYPWLHISINTLRENELQILFPHRLCKSIATIEVPPEVYQNLLTMIKLNQEQENRYTIVKPAPVVDLTTLNLDF